MTTTRNPTQQFNFTRRSLQRAITKHPPAVGKKTYFRDTAARGLVLELTHNGNATFQLYHKLLGRPVRVALGRFDPLLPDARQLPSDAARDPLTYIASRPDVSVAMARALAAAIRTAQAEGKSPRKHAAALRADPTVGELLDEYLAHISGATKRRNSADSVRAALAHLVPLRGTRSADLTRGEVVALHARVGQKYPTMANRAVLDTLRAAFNLALKHGRIVPRDNPATRIDRFLETQRDRYLSSAELALLRRALSAERQEFRDLFELLLATGARKSAVLFMRNADVDLDRAEWRVPADHSKSGESYTVPLLKSAVAILARRRAHASLRVFGFAEATLDRAWKRVFVGMQRLRLLDVLGQPATTPQTLAQLTAEAVRRRIPPSDYTIPHCTIHDLRRTVGSHAAMAGVSLHVVGKLLGHTSSRATSVYARLSQDALRDAANRASATLAAIEAEAKRADVVAMRRRRRAQ